MVGLEGGPIPQDRYWADPSAIMRDAGVTPDVWQSHVLNARTQELLLLCGRQTGKSTSAGALALMTALREPGSLTLLLSPSARQSGELLQAKVLPLYRAIARQHPTYAGGGGALVREMVMSLEFANGSRIIALPENPDGIVGYSGVSLLVIDEASRVSDELYYVVRPMLATSQGRIIALSTPKGKRGFFFTEWEGGTGWERISARASECPRIPAAFLAEERRKLGQRWYEQEYELAFHAPIDSLFDPDDIEAAFAGGASGPLFPQDDAD